MVRVCLRVTGRDWQGLMRIVKVHSAGRGREGDKDGGSYGGQCWQGGGMMVEAAKGI